MADLGVVVALLVVVLNQNLDNNHALCTLRGNDCIYPEKFSFTF